MMRPRHAATLLVLATACYLPVGWGADNALAPDPDHDCRACEGWNEPIEPFRVHGNTWYVGTSGLAALLVTARNDDGSDALVLLDGGLTQSAPLIAENISSLGYRLGDVKVILNSHAHFDHAGGIAALQRASGANVVASHIAAESLRSGAVRPYDPQAGYAPENGFPPIDDVHVVADGGTVRVGDLVLTHRWTPGHAPGSSSWFWQSCEAGECVNLVYADSLGPVSAEGFRFSAPVDEFGGKTTADMLEASTRFLREFDCGVLVSPHPFYFDMTAKLEARANDPSVNPFLNPSECAGLADRFSEALEARLTEERSGM
ncbi:subclass B3 metallo-beta-lactamase [Marinihelvus fidelis]|uniref:Subclass B3 metallo-beta-lactamase n=1 Tax=Marinihelvus fidelis TaxID=2613842 RepID=A0A5N0T9N5_9GAMM|nr:subclass B3 metallo-beta-lactamase [Marinihelvus fidelis]KAA9131662.1 subclass B3 metallo-beta-lactamase [Marinihelvus fidelis]